MKVYANIKSEIFFIDEDDKKIFTEKYESRGYSVHCLETFQYCDGNILKMEILKSKNLKGFEDFLRY